MSTRSFAVVPTANASRYLQQLCKHWSHKFPVEFDTQSGRIALTLGRAELTASEVDGRQALVVVCEAAEGSDLIRLRQVVADHLNRFAFREGELIFAWQSG